MSNLVLDPRATPLVHRNSAALVEDSYVDDVQVGLTEANAGGTQCWEIIEMRKHWFKGVSEVARKCGGEVGVVPHELGEAGREGMKELFAKEVGKEKGGLSCTFEEPGDDSFWY